MRPRQVRRGRLAGPRPLHGCRCGGVGGVREVGGVGGVGRSGGSGGVGEVEWGGWMR